MNLGHLRQKVFNWYRSNKRDLPWRRRSTLYTVLLSEFMLQQTRVDQALPYYRGFIKKFPTLKSLAQGRFSSVVKLWEGLGYYRRAKHLHETAKRLNRKERSEINLDLLSTCPGIGQYTLAAIGSIVLGAHLAVVDGNVKRVIARFLGIRKKIDDPAVTDFIHKVACKWLDLNRSGDWNEALMELGATICTPRKPHCWSCPLKTKCSAFESGDPEAFPKREVKPPRPHRLLAAAVIMNQHSKFLIFRRPDRGLLSNLWEFPNVEVSNRKDVPRVLKQYIRSTLGLDVSVDREIAQVDHAYTHFTETVYAFSCLALNGSKHLKYKQPHRWLNHVHLSRYPFPKVHKSVLEKLLCQKEH